MSKGKKSVSDARLHQKSGTAFGGFAKVKRDDGSFRMKPTGGKSKGKGKG